jgi:phospholipid transport system substrate-binding protein
MFVALLLIAAAGVFSARAQEVFDLTIRPMAETAAEDPDGARSFIIALSDDALKVLDDTTLNQQERDAAYRHILSEGFALDYIARLVLGRHGRSASKAQMEEYTRIFPDYILNIYVHRLTEFGDEQFIVGDTVAAGKKDIYVRSEIVRPNGPPVAADWRVRVRKGEFKIIDLKIEGISMAATQRERFAAKIAQVGLTGLIESLRSDAGLDDPQSANATP